MSGVSRPPALPAQERLRRSVAQTTDEQNRSYDSEGVTASQLTDSARFYDLYDHDHERSSGSVGNRPSRRDHWQNHTHSTHAPASVVYPPASVFSQQPPHDGQTFSYMEPRGGHLRPYYNATAPYHSAHTSSVAANAGLPYHAYQTPNPYFTSPQYSLNTNPPTLYHTHLHGENPSYPAGAYYVADHQHHHHRTGNIHRSEDSGHMRNRDSIRDSPRDLGYGSSMPNIGEAERIRRDLEAFQMDTMDPPHRVGRKDKERHLEKEKTRARHTNREERARVKQRKIDRKEADEMKGCIAHLTQQLTELQAMIYQEKQKKETREREMLQESRRMSFENRLRDFGHSSNTQTSVPSDRQQDLRQHHGTEQMLQKVIGLAERLWGEDYVSRNDLARLASRGVSTRRSQIETDRSEIVYRGIDTNMQREVEEMVVNFLRRLYFEDTYGHPPDLLLALGQRSSASDHSRSAHFDVSDQAADNSRAGSSSSRTAVNINSLNEQPASPKSHDFWSCRPQKKGREKYQQKPLSPKPNSKQKPSSKRRSNHGPRPPASEDSDNSHDHSSDSDPNEIDEESDSDDDDSSFSEAEVPRRRARLEKTKKPKIKRAARVPKKAAQSKHRSEESKTRAHPAYVDDKVEEGQDEWKRQKPSRYVYAPPPAPSPPHNGINDSKAS